MMLATLAVVFAGFTGGHHAKVEKQVEAVVRKLHVDVKPLPAPVVRTLTHHDATTRDRVRKLDVDAVIAAEVTDKGALRIVIYDHEGKLASFSESSLTNDALSADDLSVLRDNLASDLEPFMAAAKQPIDVAPARKPVEDVAPAKKPFEAVAPAKKPVDAVTPAKKATFDEEAELRSLGEGPKQGKATAAKLVASQAPASVPSKAAKVTKPAPPTIDMDDTPAQATDDEAPASLGTSKAHRPSATKPQATNDKTPTEVDASAARRSQTKTQVSGDEAKAASTIDNQRATSAQDPGAVAAADDPSAANVGATSAGDDPGAVSASDIEAMMGGSATETAEAPATASQPELHLGAEAGIGIAQRNFAPGPSALAGYGSSPVGAVHVAVDVQPNARLRLRLAAERTLGMTTPLDSGDASTTVSRWEATGGYAIARGRFDIAPQFGLGRRAFSIRSEDPNRSPDSTYNYLVLGARGRIQLGSRIGVTAFAALEPVVSGTEPTEMALGEATRWAIDGGATVDVRFGHALVRAAADYQQFNWTWDMAGERGAGGATDAYLTGSLSIGAEY